jgi:hypothetical protein
MALFSRLNVSGIPMTSRTIVAAIAVAVHTPHFAQYNMCTTDSGYQFAPESVARLAVLSRNAVPPLTLSSHKAACMHGLCVRCGPQMYFTEAERVVLVSCFDTNPVNSPDATNWADGTHTKKKGPHLVPSCVSSSPVCRHPLCDLAIAQDWFLIP